LPDSPLRSAAIATQADKAFFFVLFTSHNFRGISRDWHPNGGLPEDCLKGVATALQASNSRAHFETWNRRISAKFDEISARGAAI
jgi:hypothetical protein